MPEQKRKKRNKKLRAACTRAGKILYGTEREARESANRLWSKYGFRQWPYECICGTWHLTSIDPELAEALGRRYWTGGRR